MHCHTSVAAGTFGFSSLFPMIRTSKGRSAGTLLLSPRKGSLQFWPRKRAARFLPRVNWTAISSGKNLKGFICYKAGMMSAKVRDNTPDSMTKGKDIAIPKNAINQVSVNPP